MIKKYMKSYSNNNKIISLLVFLVISLFALIPIQTNARGVVVNYTNSWAYSAYYEAGGKCSDPDFSAKADFFDIKLSKSFALNVARIGNLREYENRVIQPNESITAINPNVTGSYNFQNRDSRTPSLDGLIKLNNYYSDDGDCPGDGDRFYVKNQFRGGISSQLEYTLSSSDNSIIDCSAGSSCVARDKDGTATITVSFPDVGSYYLERSYEWGNNEASHATIPPTVTTVPRACRDCTPANNYSCPLGYTLSSTRGSDRGMGVSRTCRSNTPTVTFKSRGKGGGKISLEYTLDPISYNVRVQRPNQPPVVSNVNTTDISYNTAKVNWTYSDPEGDLQVKSWVQIATDAEFNNLVFSRAQNGAFTSKNITGLTQGTTYYVRVRAEDARGAKSTWTTGQAFTTLDNSVPELVDFSCETGNFNQSPDKYTRGRVSWKYKGKDPDNLVLRLRYKKSEESEFNFRNIGNVGAIKSGNSQINNLIPGYTYDVDIQVLDEYNRNLLGVDTQWVKCNPGLTLNNYPDPVVDFTLSGEDKIANNEGTLTVNTGALVSAKWNITNNIGLLEDKCTINTTGGDGVSLFNENENGFSGNLNATTLDSNDEQTYKVNLNCIGKQAKLPVKVDQTITLKVQSFPTVNCTIGDQTIVKEGESTINLEVNVGNVPNGYSWTAGVNKVNMEKQKSGSNTTPTNLNISLDYSGIPFGRYQPWVEITKKVGDTDRTTEATCGRVTNLGKSNIREVNP